MVIITERQSHSHRARQVIMLSRAIIRSSLRGRGAAAASLSSSCSSSSSSSGVILSSSVRPLSFSLSSSSSGAAAALWRPLASTRSFASSSSGLEGKKTYVKVTVGDGPGSLQHCLGVFEKHKVNMTRIESKPSKTSSNYDMYIDFMGTPEEDNNVTELLKDLHQSFPRVQVLSSRLVPWFPRRMSELDSIANNTLDAGAALQSDHPGFSDMAYRASRERIAELARNYKMGEPIPIPTYTTEEHKCWSEVYNKLMPLVETSACSEYRRMIPLLRDNCDFGPDRIPSLQDVSAFLGDSTGFVLRPVAGLLSSRNFLYGLAFRVFFCTQYIRHHSKPLYTPEPDICHELLGHAPLFADKDFAEFSQAIGMASLGATDEQIVALARCYWFSVEFGLCKEKETGDVRAYGAGLLSSFGELEYCMTDEPEKRPFVPDLVGLQDFPITTYQPIYFVADSFTDAKDRMVDYAQGFSRPFNVRYDAYTKSIDIDALIEMDESTKIEESVSY